MSGHQRENLFDAVQPGGKRVDFRWHRVQSEGGARGAGHAEAAHQRFRAMMPGAHGDTLAVQQGCDVMRMRIAAS